MPSMRCLQSFLYAFLVVAATASANDRVNDALRSKILADHLDVSVAFASATVERQQEVAVNAWIAQASPRLQPWIASMEARMTFVRAVHRESRRAHLDPDLLLAIIQMESTFRQFAVSPKGALGYMQVMPFWVKAIGRDDHDLLDTRINLRYGTVILRHYIERERGDLIRALSRYKGTPDRDDYAKVVIDTWRQWRKLDGPAPSEPVRMARIEAN